MRRLPLQTSGLCYTPCAGITAAMRAFVALLGVSALSPVLAQTADDAAVCELVGCTEHQLVQAYQAVLNADPDVSCGNGGDEDGVYNGQHTTDTVKYKCVTTGCSSEQIATQFLKHLDCNAGCGSNKSPECPSVKDQMRVQLGALLQPPMTISDDEHEFGTVDDQKKLSCENDQHDNKYLHYSSLDECWDALQKAFPQRDANGNPQISSVFSVTDADDPGTVQTVLTSVVKGQENWDGVYKKWKSYGCKLELSSFSSGEMTLHFFKGLSDPELKAIDKGASYDFMRRRANPGFFFCKRKEVNNFDDCTCENGVNTGPNCVDREAKLDTCTACNDGYTLNDENKCV